MAVFCRFILLFLLCAMGILARAEDSFDVRLHLSTVTRYDAAKGMPGREFVPSSIPSYCKPMHLNLLARHGTRAPTKKKLKELESLATRLEVLLENVDKNSNLIPGWLFGWKSPWTRMYRGGELTSAGESELFELGVRTIERFTELFEEEYHPDTYPIIATQVPRASASAVAFGMGLFRGKGSLGQEHHRAFAVISESRASDIMLRFHDCCQNYKTFRKSQEPSVNNLKLPVLNEIAHAFFSRWGMNVTGNDVSSLWYLCKQEASLLNTTDQACALFNPNEVRMLEWTDDLELFILKGYGNSLNYRMGVALLKDVIHSMEQAVNASEDGNAARNHEKARIRVAHAETLLPFSCLIGLFLDQPEFELLLREQPLNIPPQPPQKRAWHGSTIVPFAGNSMLVLYRCSANNSNKYFVQVLHNERPIPLAGCGDSDFCPFEVFKERIAAPHLKHDYNLLCSAADSSCPVRPSFAARILQLLSWIFRGDAVNPKNNEL